MRILTIVFLLLCCPHVSHADTLLKKLECGVLHEAVPAITLQSEGTPLTILIIGSSSTSGVGAGAPENAYPAQTANHLRQALKRTDITVVARGKGGERAKAALDRFETAIAETKPNLLIWQVGTNDALAKIPLDDLRETLKSGLRIAEQKDLPVILVDPQFFPKVLKNGHYSATIDALETFGHDHALPVVKRYERMKRALALSDEAMAKLLAKDRFHMSALGHQCLAQDLSATISAALSQNRTVAKTD